MCQFTSGAQQFISFMGQIYNYKLLMITTNKALIASLIVMLASTGAVLTPYYCGVAFEGEDWEQQFEIDGGSGNYSLTYSGLPKWVSANANKLSGNCPGKGRWPITIDYVDLGTGEKGRRSTYIVAKPKFTGNDDDLWTLSRSSYYPKAKRTITVQPVNTQSVYKIGDDCNISFSATGGSGKYKWKYSNIPDGLAYSDNVITGKPKSSGTYNLGVNCVDESGSLGVSVYTINVVGGLTKHTDYSADLKEAAEDLAIATRQKQADENVQSALNHLTEDQKLADSAQAAFDTANDALAKAKSQAKAAADALKAAQNIANNASQNLANAQTTLNNALSALSAAQTAQNNSLAAVSAAQQALATAQSNFNSAQAAFNAANSALNAAQTAYNNASTALATAQAQATAAQQALTQAQNNLTAAQNALTTAVNNQKTTAAQLAQAQANANAAQAAFNSAKAANDAAQAALSTATAANAAAQTALDQAKANQDAACKANDIAQANLKQAKNELYEAQEQKAEADRATAQQLAEHTSGCRKHTLATYTPPVVRSGDCQDYNFPLSAGSEIIRDIDSNGCLWLGSGRKVHISPCTVKSGTLAIGSYVKWNGHFEGAEIWANQVSCN